MRHLSRAAIGLLAVLLAGSALAAPRPISEAERAAVQIAVDYLNRGPQAVAEQLSATSPLRRLPPTAQLEEIEVRLGPPAGAAWELQTAVPSVADRMAIFAVEFPSGIDDAAIFDLTKEGNAYKVENIRMLGEKSAKKPIFAPLPPEPALKADAASGFSPAAIILTLAVLAAALAGAGAFTSDGLSRILIPAALVIAVGAAAMAIVKDPRFGIAQKKVEEVKAPVTRDDNAHLAALLPLRRAIAAGGAEADALFAKAPRNDVVNVWRAQWELQQTRTENATKSLAAFPTPSDIPLAEIVRARLALLNGDDANAVLAFERAINLGPGRDGLWMEAAQALMALGFDDRATEYLTRTEEIGSRSADVYYIRAMLLATKNKQQDAEAKLKTAWAMRPVERARLVEAAVLWSVLRSATMAQTVSLASPSEASFAAPELGSRTIGLPANAWPSISGSFLHLQIGEQELDVPGGAALAPAFALAVDAAAWQRDEDVRAMKQVPQLLASANAAGAYASPSLRRRMVRAARALAAHNRWDDLVALTNGVTPAAEHMPPELFFLRSVALEHTEHAAEAKQVVVSLAASRVLQRKNDAQALADLGNRLASFDEYDAAMKLLERAQNIRQRGSLDDRLRQLDMNKRLANAFLTYKTPHFEIHYPQEAGARFAEAMGGILEKELARLQQWVPVPNFKPVIINVLEWRDFRSTYTGSDFILGFYEGKITLPFAGVDHFSPPVVTILSHELLHAMLAQATHGQAPHWFQEGLAQRIEMKQYSPNAFNMYTDDKLLAVTLLDAVLRGSPDPEMIEQAYIESQTTIRYVEAKYGPAGVTKLIAAFRDGATTEDAIARLSGGSLAKFDADMRAWGRSAAHVFDNPPIVDYEPEDSGIHFTRRDS